MFSIAEERISRTKAYLGSICSAKIRLDNGILNPTKISEVAVSVNHFPEEIAETLSFLLTEDKKYYDIQNDDNLRVIISDTGGET